MINLYYVENCLNLGKNKNISNSNNNNKILQYQPFTKTFCQNYGN
jgi:hypothetical protein